MISTLSGLVNVPTEVYLFIDMQPLKGADTEHRCWEAYAQSLLLGEARWIYEAQMCDFLLLSG